jgi:excisionase family DNA binding protein
MSMSTAQRWLTVKEAAERCRLSTTWFYRRIRHKRPDAPPHIWLGGTVRIPAQEFDDWLKERAS